MANSWPTAALIGAKLYGIELGHREASKQIHGREDRSNILQIKTFLKTW